MIPLGPEPGNAVPGGPTGGGPVTPTPVPSVAPGFPGIRVPRQRRPV